MKILYSLPFILLMLFSKSQMLITTNSEEYTVPDASAALHIADSDKGVLLPRVYLNSSTDATTVNTPAESVLVYNTKDEKFKFWSENKWNKQFEVSDAVELIEVTKNFTGNSSNKVTIDTFPAAIPNFTLGSGTTGWTDLNVSTTIPVTKPANTNLVTVEGMTQIDNVNTASSYQFAIGIFVDNQLKIVRKFFGYSTNATCLWKKFNLAGVFENLSVGNHVVKVYAYNLPKLSNNYTLISYGGASSTSCNNLNEEMARIYITAQLAE